MDRSAFRERLGILQLPDYLESKAKFKRDNPHWFADVGTMIFCGHQGAGKTLSAVNYVYNLWELYPNMILVTNVALKDYPFNAGYRVTPDGRGVVYDLKTDETIRTGDYHNDQNDIVLGKYSHVCIEYDGLDSLKYICNDQCGVVYLIDELHLELNSLESKNVDIEVMIEISQQRKQRKKIIGTSQQFMRLAKPLREQVFDVVICNNYFGCLQFNKSIDGFSAYEEGGKLQATVKKRCIYVHRYEMYDRYDTYAKMRRYNNVWNGHRRDPIGYAPDNLNQIQFKKAKGVKITC